MNAKSTEDCRYVTSVTINSQKGMSSKQKGTKSVCSLVFCLFFDKNTFSIIFLFVSYFQFLVYGVKAISLR